MRSAALPKTFEHYFTEQLRLHPSMEPQDACKLCYQAAHGGEHLLKDLTAARAYLARELEVTPADGDIPLYEMISPCYARVNLAAWKAAGRSADELFALFAAGGGAQGQIEEFLSAAEGVWAQSGRDRAAWSEFVCQYRRAGCPALHHSAAYRAAERPAYRLVKAQLITTLHF